ncbi:MAG: dephospho-CoA kinase [Pseudomonadota bacterium]|jgi:dephospho-CoA kinase
MIDITALRFCKRFSVGLTGGIASGKSTVATMFSALGAAIVDTDIIAHQLTAGETILTRVGVAMPAITQAFGSTFIQSDGGLNRAMMRRHILNDSKERLRLESILHPMIHYQAQFLGNTLSGNYVIFVVPLLIESPQWRRQVDRILVIDCDLELQRQRLLQRAGVTMVQADQLLAIQASREQRLIQADDTLDNTAMTIEQLQHHINQLHHLYLKQ